VVRAGPTERNYNRTGLKQRLTRKEFRCQSLVPNMEAPLIIVKIIVTRTHEHKSFTAGLVGYVNVRVNTFVVLIYMISSDYENWSEKNEHIREASRASVDFLCI
jgi:hypothetical protein